MADRQYIGADGVQVNETTSNEFMGAGGTQINETVVAAAAGNPWYQYQQQAMVTGVNV